MHSSLHILASEAAATAPDSLDLTDPAHLAQAESLADTLGAAAACPGDLRELESALVRDPETPLAVHVATKLALARAQIDDLPTPLHLSVVFAVYKEHERILPADEVAGGVDLLVRKAAQLEWLAAGHPDLRWEMVVVDDGCPEGSGNIAARIASSHSWGDRIRVLRLADAIAADDPVTRPLTDTAQSMKGGAVTLGLATAAAEEKPNHVILFTDADLSTHLGQAGLLIDRILGRGYDAAIGSRREPASVVVEQGVHNTRGKLFIYLWKRLIDILPDVVDTQCGFKAFAADTVRDITSDLLEKKFAFDVELLIRTRLRRDDSLARVPIAWIDNDALSTTTDLQPYLPMLRAMVAMYRRYLPPRDEADTFAAFIEELDDNSWARLLDNIPTAIAENDPVVFGKWNGVSAGALRKAAGVS